ncbi:MAG: M23 family metallopeptidase [Treponema sp.]|nr:M23 family metallopeptidase [Treponema sp.]
MLCNSVYTYTQTFPSGIELKDSYEAEFELLTKAMTTFALEDSRDYDSDGNLLDAGSVSEKDMEKLFRQPVKFQTYKVQPGDTISGITKKFGLKNISTLIAVNDIGNVRTLCAGQKLKIPSLDGLFYTVEKGNSLAGLSSKFGVTMEDLLDVNDLDSASLSVGQSIFIPGAKLDGNKLQQAMGELFKCPVQGKYRLTSLFGPRMDPFTGARSNHTGIDMACPTGTPIVASSTGTVVFTGVSPVFGNYVIIRHSNGYQSLYGHMSKILAHKGQWVSQGTRIGLAGSTGYSTGPHLHFTVYKNGKLVDPLSLIK